MHRLTPKFALRYAALTASAAAIVSLSGCAGITGTALPTSSAMSIAVPQGSVHGGQQPIAFAHVYLYAANDSSTGVIAGCPATTGYGSPACSLLPSAPTTAVDSNGNYYLTTNASGGFNYGSGLVSCPSADAQIYILAVSGNATGFGPATNANNAIALSAALGTCSNITAATFTSINEVTTAAMAFGLGRFMTTPTNVGSPASASAVTSLKKAFTTVANLVDNTTGTARATTINGSGTVSNKTINSVADMLAVCVNSGSASSTGCSTLFTNTNVPAAPTDTLTSAINLASYPSQNPTNLYASIPANPPFQPIMTFSGNGQATDFAVSIKFAVPSVAQAGALAIDGSDNIWMTSCQTCLAAPPTTPLDSIVQFDSMGNYVASNSTGIHNPQGLAIDSTSANLYSTNQAVGTSVDQLLRTSLAAPAVATPITAGTYSAPSGVAVDNSGNVWVTNAGNASILYVSTPSTTPTLGNTFNGMTTGLSSLSLPLGIGVDNNGLVWVAATNSNPTAGSMQFTPAAIVELNTTTVLGYYDSSAITGLAQPIDISITGGPTKIVTFDGSSANGSITVVAANGTGQTYGPIGLNQAALTAVDGDNNVLIPTCDTGSKCVPAGGTSGQDGLVRFSTVTNTAVKVSSPSFNGAAGIAIDSVGNAWVSNSTDGTITEVIGFAAPTINPLAKASTAALIGTRPN